MQVIEAAPATYPDAEAFPDKPMGHPPVAVGQFDANHGRRPLYRCLQLRVLRHGKGGASGLLEHQGCSPSFAEGRYPPSYGVSDTFQCLRRCRQALASSRMAYHRSPSGAWAPESPADANL